MRRNLLKKISTRIFLSYSVPLVCLFSLSIFAYLNARRTFVLEAKRDYIQSSDSLTHDATYHLVGAIRKVKSNALSPDETHYIGLYTISRETFVANIAKLQTLSEQQSDAELAALVESLSAEGDRIDSTAQQIFAALAAGNAKTATTLVAGLESDDVDTHRQAILDYLANSLSQNTADFEIAREQLLRSLLWGTAIAAAATLGLGIWLAQQIRRQVQSIVTVVEENGIQVTTSSTQIAASSRQLETSLSQQVASTTQITATATEIAATSEELTYTINEVVEKSEAAAVIASSGKADLESMSDTIQQLSVATATISSKLGLIDDKANNISAVVTAINKVADQTNLLSLNAAIEAEKAGEYGAGFSVVAREIRRLADQTAIATLDIETMVQEMLSSVSAGVMEMDKFTQDVSTNADSISQISDQMAHIIHQVQSLVPQFERVSNGMLAQSEGAQQIRTAMEQLNETSQQTADSVKDTHQVIGRLSNIAQDLQKEVADFRLAV